MTLVQFEGNPKSIFKGGRSKGDIEPSGYKDPLRKPT